MVHVAGSTATAADIVVPNPCAHLAFARARLARPPRARRGGVDGTACVATGKGTEAPPLVFAEGGAEAFAVAGAMLGVGRARLYAAPLGTRRPPRAVPAGGGGAV